MRRVSERERDSPYSLLVLAMVLIAFLPLFAPLWLSVMYGGFLFCALLSKRGV